MTLVMITGGIDFSVTSIIALTSVVGAKLMGEDGATTPLGVSGRCSRSVRGWVR